MESLVKVYVDKMNEEEIIKLNCKKCNKIIKTSPKGWARKYCEKCRKLEDREYAKKRYQKNINVILKRKEKLKLSPRKKFVSCHKCHKKIKNTCWNKKYCSDCKKKQHSKVSKNWANENPEKRKEIDARRSPEKRKEYHIKRRKENPEYIHRLDRERYIRDGEKRRELVRKYHRENKDTVRDTKRNYRKSDHGREKVKGHGRKRRALKNKAIHGFSPEEWKLKLEKTQGICPQCENFFGKVNLHLDHDPPLSKVPEGFIYTVNEVKPLCSSCNSRKYNKLSKESEKKIKDFLEKSKNK